MNSKNNNQTQNRPNPVYLEGMSGNMKYGCSVDADHLGSSYGTKKSSGMKAPFLYELGFSPSAKNPEDYCCLFVIEPRDCTIVGTIPVSHLGDEKAKPDSFDFDFDDNYMQICIKTFESSELFEKAVNLATPVEGAFQSMRIEYEKMLRTACRLDTKAIKAFTQVIGLEHYDNEKIKNSLRKMYSDIIRNNVMTVDEILQLGGHTPQYLETFGFTEKRGNI